MASLQRVNPQTTMVQADPNERARPAVELSNVTRVFGAVPALVRTTLSIERGQCLLLRGPNGAGKSTLLRIIATAISPTYGSGAVFGHDLVGEREQIRRKIELLGHRTRLYDDLTGRENLSFVAALYDIEAPGVGPALDRVGLTDVADERVRRYSQGMRQRLALARVLLRAPELLLLDEPYAGLDDTAKTLVDQSIEEARTAGRTVILATHDPTRGAMADRVLFLDRGRLLPELTEELSEEDAGG